jgi:exonuclease RecJ (EC 3.1.-.-)
MEKWFVINKGADFAGIAKRFGISPVTARLIRNREVMGDEAIARYLKGGIGELYDPHLLLDSDRLTDILVQKISEQKKIRVIGDYDIDGVMSTYILYKGITRCGGSVDFQIPDRMKDGYGINDHLIEQADEAGIDTIITCDNGIAAIGEIAHAKSLGMTVLVTDHHEIPYTEERGERHYKRSEADAIVNPKQMECTYPYKNLCGAAVAWKVIQILYEKCDIAVEESYDFLENVAFATVGDVMDLTDENRILVREGLKRIHTTMNPGMRALILQNKLEPEQISSYHFGFVLGPCINASGRLETAKIALNLFLQEDVKKASEIAAELVDLNAQRKDMTAEGVELAMQQVEEGNTGEKVLVVYLPDVHESLAGIIAGRIREACHKPTFVLTKSEDGVKGSGRSIEAYSMYEELCKCQELFTKFGGHPMAAGLSLPEANVEIFREKINACCGLTEEDFIPKIKIDIPMPVDYPDIPLVNELLLLEPFGKANVKPQFADKNLGIDRAVVVGKNQNVLKLTLKTERGKSISAVYFGDVEEFREYYGRK